MDCSKMSDYLKSLESSVKASTHNAKLSRIHQGIHFLALTLDVSGLMEVQRIESLTKNWSAVLAKSSRVANRERMEDQSEKPQDFGDIDALVQSKVFQDLFKTLVRTAKAGKPVDNNALHNARLWLAGCLLHTNSQRPGAIANMTTLQCKKGLSKSKASIRVTEHQTRTTGSTMLTVK